MSTAARTSSRDIPVECISAAMGNLIRATRGQLEFNGVVVGRSHYVTALAQPF